MCIIGKTIKIHTFFLKWITKKLAVIRESEQSKDKSARYFPGPFNPCLYKSEIYIKKCCGLFHHAAKTNVSNKKSTSSAGTFLRFLVTNSNLEIFRGSCIFKFWGNQIPRDWLKIPTWIITTPNCVYSRYLKLFTAEMLNGKLYFLCSVNLQKLYVFSLEEITKNNFGKIVAKLKNLCCNSLNIVVMYRK